MTCFICPMTKEKRCDDGCGLCFNCPRAAAEITLSWGVMTEDLVYAEPLPLNWGTAIEDYYAELDAADQADAVAERLCGEHGFYVDDEGAYPERGPRRRVR